MLKLMGDGVHWHGTFGVVLGALLADLLPDGPLPATVTLLDDNDDEVVIAGDITADFAGYVMLAEGQNVHQIPRDRIIGLEV